MLPVSNSISEFIIESRAYCVVSPINLFKYPIDVLISSSFPEPGYRFVSLTHTVNAYLAIPAMVQRKHPVRGIRVVVRDQQNRASKQQFLAAYRPKERQRSDEHRRGRRLLIPNYSPTQTTDGIKTPLPGTRSEGQKRGPEAGASAAVPAWKTLSKDGHGPRILLNSGHSQLGSAYYFVFNYVPREPRWIRDGVVKRPYNLIATAICVLSKCICPLGNWFSVPRILLKIRQSPRILSHRGNLAIPSLLPFKQILCHIFLLSPFFHLRLKLF